MQLPVSTHLLIWTLEGPVSVPKRQLINVWQTIVNTNSSERKMNQMSTIMRYVVDGIPWKRYQKCFNGWIQVNCLREGYETSKSNPTKLTVDWICVNTTMSMRLAMTLSVMLWRLKKKVTKEATTTASDWNVQEFTRCTLPYLAKKSL